MTAPQRGIWIASDAGEKQKKNLLREMQAVHMLSYGTQFITAR
jgi:hypothetical protein